MPIPQSTLKAIESNLQYQFKNPKKLVHALTHSSHKNEFLNTGRKRKALDLIDNERLEFFGDAILSFIINKQLYNLYPDKDEGALSKYRSLLVSRKSLFTIAKKLNLHHYLRLGKSENKIKLKDKTKMLADSFEAIIAAIYFDRGMQATEKFVLGHFESYLELSKLKRLNSSENYKSILQELTQKNHHILPRYRTVLKGESFAATVYFQNKAIGTACGRSKREAEKKAACEALKYYKQKIKKS